MKKVREQVRELVGKNRSESVGVQLLIGTSQAMISLLGMLRSGKLDGLLIRRSWVRDPPGSFFKLHFSPPVPPPQGREVKSKK